MMNLWIPFIVFIFFGIYQIFQGIIINKNNNYKGGFYKDFDEKLKKSLSVNHIAEGIIFIILVCFLPVFYYTHRNIYMVILIIVILLFPVIRQAIIRKEISDK